MPTQVSLQLTDAQIRQIEALTAAGFGNRSDVVRIAVDRMYREEIRTMMLHIHTSDVEHDVDLSMFPYIDGQFTETDDGYITVINLAARRDTTAAQEQYLNTHPAVVSYQVVDSRGCAHGDGVCPAAINAAPRNIERGTIIECPHCHRTWQGDYWSERGDSSAAWSWRPTA